MSILSATVKAGDDRRRIPRQSLHDNIVAQVRDMITEGELGAGTRINETSLGDLLGVSRTPLREALKYLASEGLVELVPSRGAVVRKFGAAEIGDMMSVLRTLEEMGARLACKTASDEQIEEIRALHDEMMACYRRRDRLRYYKLNQAIHTAIAEAGGNAVLAAVQGQLQMRLKRIRFLGHEAPENWDLAIAEHEEMIKALEARDADGLADALGGHLHRAWERVRDFL